MANTKSAKKRIRSTERKTLRNKMRQSKVRTAVRKAREALAAGETQAARTAVLQAASQLDKAAENGVIHPNSAARRKGRLMKRLASLGSENGE